jgi:phage shock protein A
MGLLERVTMLLRANLNDLIDRAEEPETVLKQVILDMQNQLLQVKTQVAMAVADQHLLEKKLKEHRDRQADALRQAEFALEKGREDLARHAAEQSFSAAELAASFARQLEDQRLQVENLKSVLFRLGNKLGEARTRSELLMSQQRRARALGRAVEAHAAIDAGATSMAFDRMNDKVQRAEAVSQAKAELETADQLQEQLLALGKQEKIDRILEEIRQRKGVA